jgi:hypothetical protein
VNRLTTFCMHFSLPRAAEPFRQLSGSGRGGSCLCPIGAASGAVSTMSLRANLLGYSEIKELFA